MRRDAEPPPPRSGLSPAPQRPGDPAPRSGLPSRSLPATAPAASIRDAKSPGRPTSVVRGGSFGSRALVTSSSSGALSPGGEASTSGRREEDNAVVAVAAQPAAPNPFSPAAFFKTIDDFSSPMRDFFSKSLGVALVPIPTFLDEREMLRARLHELEERLRNVESATGGEIRELKAALAKAESALEASKLERARSAVETMKHWRQHRREVEKLRDDQSALMASVGDLRAVRAEADKLRAERDAAISRVAALEAQLAKAKR